MFRAVSGLLLCEVIWGISGGLSSKNVMPGWVTVRLRHRASVRDHAWPLALYVIGFGKYILIEGCWPTMASMQDGQITTKSDLYFFRKPARYGCSPIGSCHAWQLCNAW